MKKDKRLEELENVIRQMLNPIKGVPFYSVIEATTGKKVFEFDTNEESNQQLLEKLRIVAEDAGGNINIEGIRRRRANEVGNDVEGFVFNSLRKYNLNPRQPMTSLGKTKSTGYPDLLFFHEGKPIYLECETYNSENIRTTQRSFSYSPSEEPKVIFDAPHLAISFEVYDSSLGSGSPLFRVRNYKILDLRGLLVNVKHELNSDNRRLYAVGEDSVVLAEGSVPNQAKSYTLSTVI